MKLKIDYSIKPSLLDWKTLEHPDRTDTVEIDTEEIELMTTLKKGEEYVQGSENLYRLKAMGKSTDKTLLDARIFEELMKHPEAIPEKWKEKTNGWTKYVFFPGTILANPCGDRCVMYLHWFDGGWDWSYYLHERGWNADILSAVLASPLAHKSKSSDYLSLDGEVIEIKGEKYKLVKQ